MPGLLSCGLTLRELYIVWGGGGGHKEDVLAAPPPHRFDIDIGAKGEVPHVSLFCHLLLSATYTKRERKSNTVYFRKRRIPPASFYWQGNRGGIVDSFNLTLPASLHLCLLTPTYGNTALCHLCWRCGPSHYWFSGYFLCIYLPMSILQYST